MEGVHLPDVVCPSRTVKITNVPANTDAMKLKEFLESLLKENGCVYACKVLPTKNPRHETTQAIVQFEKERLAQKLCGISEMELMYKLILLLYNDTHVLSVDPLERDLVKRPRRGPVEVATTRVYLGCQVNHNEYCVLWSSTGHVDFELCANMKKVFIVLIDHGIKYMLVSSFGSIQRMHHYGSASRGTKYLVMPLYCAPSVFYKEDSSSSADDAQGLEYYKYGSDTNWIRTTDFTGNFGIGQCSSICMELPNGAKDKDIKGTFYNYKVIKGNLSLQMPFFPMPTSRLVPLIDPPGDLDIPYQILYHVNLLVQEGVLSWPTLKRDFFSLLQPTREKTVHCILSALDEMYYSSPSFNPEKILKKSIHARNTRRYADRNSYLDGGLVRIHRAQVTPTKIYLCRPEVNVSNRVIRQFSRYMDDFLRVSFVDEDGKQLHAYDLCRKMSNGDKLYTRLYQRVVSVLKEGIVIGRKKFEFLAYSNSQLRESSLWMFASNENVTAENIRNWMGDFMSIRNVAKCAARMGQSFSSSRKTLRVLDTEVEDLNDITVGSGNERYVFSDGIGKISASLAAEVASICGCTYTPSAFQIRYGGYKGVVAVDPFSTYKLSLRPSMKKFDSKDTFVDVLSWTKFRPCFLNRQIITLLSTLGVEDQAFEKLQEEVVSRLDQVLNNKETALEVLQIMGGGEHHDVIVKMLQCGYSPEHEPYLSMILHAFRAAKLLELKVKTRIFVPEGRCLMGCLDESGTLEYGEVFVQVTEPQNSQFDGRDPSQTILRSNKKVITGRVIIAKNPCLHPGDVQILQTVDFPWLHHMVNCVVFPQKGERPHPNECSGSDLDGDLYFICWDESLIPPQVESPMNYFAPPEMALDHDVTVEEIQEFFANYMLNDALGIISARHTVFADSEPEMARSKSCLDLAKLFTLAVDFPKTGVPAEVPSTLNPKEYPDFMEKEDKPTYMSKRVIGNLYRAIKDYAMQSFSISSFTREVAHRTYDKDLEHGAYHNYIDAAFNCKNYYDSSLASIMHHYGIKYEAEIVSGNIFSWSKYHGLRLGNRDAILMDVKALRKELRSFFETNVKALVADEYEMASAWYHITYHPQYWGYGDYTEKDRSKPHFISFPWIVHDKLLTIKRNKTKGSKLLPALFSDLKVT